MKRMRRMYVDRRWRWMTLAAVGLIVGAIFTFALLVISASTSPAPL